VAELPEQIDADEAAPEPAQSQGEAAPDALHPRGEDLAELRRLLVGREQQRLTELEQRLESDRINAQKLARLLPEAVAHSTAQDEQLGVVLAPTIERAIDTSVRKDPQKLVTAIAPVMGPAIRRAILQALRNLVESLNRTLKHSLSLRGLKWRWEALRTGKPFAEVVLAHTLLYRVEQVFLIHRETGLLLRHEAAESSAVRDEDMFSAMLTAIQDFVRDSMGTRDGEGIETLQIGEWTVWVHQGPMASLAGVIRGSPPGELRALFETTLETIHLQLPGAMDGFEGDTAPFEAAGPHLRACLAQAQRDVERRKHSPLLWLIPAAVLLALGYWGVASYLRHSRWNGLLHSLRAEPGIVVTESGRSGGKYFVRGLRDPLSRDPQEILEASGFGTREVDLRWKAYQGFAPRFVLRRAEGILNPPKGVKLALSEGVLTATGRAPTGWIIAARPRARLIPGVARYVDDGLVWADGAGGPLARAKALLAPPPSVVLTLRDGVLRASGSAPHLWILEARRKARSLADIQRYEDRGLTDETAAAFEAARKRVEAHGVHFLLGSPDLPPTADRRLRSVAADLLVLDRAAAAFGRSVRVEISGHTDSAGTAEMNLRLSRQRADRVLARLADYGVPASRMQTQGLGNTQPVRPETTEENRAANRRVSFHVILSPATQPAGR